LDQVEGIGPKTKELLLKEFKSLKRIKAAPKPEIIELLGKTKGVKIYQKLQQL
jgi:excinuclease ABC subunit C